MRIRPAQLADLPRLTSLEQRSFPGDRISPRQLRRFVRSEHSRPLVLEENDEVLGYVLVLYRQHTHLARIYSLAVDPQQRGRGLGRLLLRAAEQDALEHGYLTLRLEVRQDNQPARQLYAAEGYQPIRTLAHYYDDLADGLRLQKHLTPQRPRSLLAVPYYSQTLPFSCGPACLLMAWRYLEHDAPWGRMEELRLWREATTIFMTSGHGGCSPEGLALAAQRRGLHPRLWVSQRSAPFLRGVRNPEKQTVIALVHQQFNEELEQLSLIPTEQRADLTLIDQQLAQGHPLLVLISSYRLTGDKAPHWVVVIGSDQHFIYLHDPESDHRHLLASMMEVPVRREEFQAMMQYGRERYSAVLALSRAS